MPLDQTANNAFEFRGPFLCETYTYAPSAGDMLEVTPLHKRKAVCSFCLVAHSCWHQSNILILIIARFVVQAATAKRCLPAAAQFRHGLGVSHNVMLQEKTRLSTER